MRLTRRELLRGAGVFAGAVLLCRNTEASHRKNRRSPKKTSVKASRIVESGPLSGNRLYEDVIAYYNLGEHRTATQTDLKTSQWLLDQLRGAGLKATTQTFQLRQFFLHQTRLMIGDKSIRAFPLWYPRASGADPIASSLAILDTTAPRASLGGKAALVRFPANAGNSALSDRHFELIRSATKAGAAAVIAISEGPTKEIVALNSPPGYEPWPVPVVLVGQRDEGLLLAAVKSSAKIILTLDGNDDREAKARNVIARLDRGKNLIVISTPQSGWFRCAAERGPGIALFLGLARWANRRTAGSSFLFVSTSGHELGGLGMQAFLRELAPQPDRVLCWLHLGAGIATYPWEETQNGLKRLEGADSKRLLMATSDLVPVISNSFAGLNGLAPTIGRPVGEFEYILKAGHRGFGIAAAHRFHHTPADSPEMTGAEILEPVGRALLNALEAIEQTSRG